MVRVVVFYFPPVFSMFLDSSVYAPVVPVTTRIRRSGSLRLLYFYLIFRYLRYSILTAPRVIYYLYIKFLILLFCFS